jgi:hypothetical protein
MFLFHVPPAPHLIAVRYFKNRSLHPHTIYVAPPPNWMPEMLRSKCVLQRRCSTEPISPLSAVRGPSPATHPGKVDITAALHMASLVDAYRSQRMSSAPESPPASQGPVTAVPRTCIDTSSIAADLWLAGSTNPSCSVGSDLQAAPAYAAVFAMFWSGHLPEPTTACQALQIAQPLPPPTPIPPVPGATLK